MGRERPLRAYRSYSYRVAIYTELQTQHCFSGWHLCLATRFPTSGLRQWSDQSRCAPCDRTIVSSLHGDKAMDDLATGKAIPNGAKKGLIRRSRRDQSQRVRHTVQWLFAALNGWIGLQFLLWVRYYERAGNSLFVS